MFSDNNDPEKVKISPHIYKYLLHNEFLGDKNIFPDKIYDYYPPATKDLLDWHIDSTLNLRAVSYRISFSIFTSSCIKFNVLP